MQVAAFVPLRAALFVAVVATSSEPCLTEPQHGGAEPKTTIARRQSSVRAHMRSILVILVILVQ
jgi:hypothetical protein